LAYELRKAGLIAIEELYFNVVYDGITFDKGFRMDMLVEDRFVLELKVAEKIMPNHVAATLSYLRFGKVKRGLILNFAEKHLKNGIQRLIIPDIP
jgi:GxxExxY protein